mmetsp:Transcript_27314/g.62658  ORF Transcript_27314/g.62658 Transcript_27314/m.62658 type:complete len:189 (+) Transcript_27314:624-1190(+)
MVPVDWRILGLSDYPEIIKKPMDLGTVKSRMESEQYSSVQKALDDIRLIWSNCKTYNQDGSDFFTLAIKLEKKFEALCGKHFKKPVEKNSVPSNQPKATLEDKRAFARNLYKITKDELGKVIMDLDEKSPESLTKNAAEDEVEINVDNITNDVFWDVVAYVKSCVGETGRKKKSSSTGKGQSKKSKAS